MPFGIPLDINKKESSLTASVMFRLISIFAKNPNQKPEKSGDTDDSIHKACQHRHWPKNPGD